MMIKTVFRIYFLVFLCNLVRFSESQVLTVAPFSINGYNRYTGIVSTCQSQGFDIYNPASYACEDCAATKVKDTSVIDAIGNYIKCKCEAGYFKVLNSCASDVTGGCASFSCSTCLNVTGRTSYSDGSACVSCDSSTSG